MNIAIVGTNGMLSKALTQMFYAAGNNVEVWGLEKPQDYLFSQFYRCNLLKEELDYIILAKNDIIIYAAGAGVQAELSVPSSLIYALNVSAPIGLTLRLKDIRYKGVFVSFGSYMEIGINKNNYAFNEDEIVCSSLPVSNDYALSKRLYSRYMRDFSASYINWHFILPNLFSQNDIQPGTRLLPYILQTIKDIKMGIDVQPRFSTGTQFRQFIMLDELFDVICRSYDKSLLSGIYCVGGGEQMSIKQLVQRVYHYYGIECKDTWFGVESRRDGDIPSLLLNGSKLYSCIGYEPMQKIEDLLSKLIFNY